MKNYFPFLVFLLFFSSGFTQEAETVDFSHLKAEITINPYKKQVSGNVSFRFNILKDTDSIYVDAREMQLEKVRLDGKKIDFSNNGRQVWFFADFKKSSKTHQLSFSYSVQPSQTMYFVGWGLAKPETAEESHSPQVWTQGQGKYTSCWLPSFDDTHQKMEFDLSYEFPTGYEVISNGRLLQKKEVNDSITRWDFDMEHPMSSYLVAMAAGKYKVDTQVSARGTKNLLYYYPRDSARVEPTYRYTQEIMDLFEAETGMDFPWENYRQIPVREFLYSGMENTGATIFSDVFMVDSLAFKDRNYVMVNAHEMAHQWFGDLVTAASSEHHWLQEGFASYFALLAEKEVFGEDFFYWNLYQTAEQLKDRSDSGKGQAVLNPKANSLTFYQKGAWALHILREKIGAENFKKGIQEYLERYKFKTANTQDFIAEMEKASGKELSGFVEEWLKKPSFPATQALNSLKNSDFLKKYMEIAALKATPWERKKNTLFMALDFPVNEYVGQEVVYQLASEDPKNKQVQEWYQKAFETNNFLVRQAIATSLQDVPSELKSAYEDLLNDSSYLTQEIAFLHLWLQFPDERSYYLDEMKGRTGFMDKNIELLWLSLNLATPEYDMDHKQQIYQKLSNYSSPYFPFQIREKALQYLSQLHALNEQNLRDLMQGTMHPVSRFRTACRDLLRDLLKNEDYRFRFQEISSDLPENERNYLKISLSSTKS